jgi:endonuclease YncB( thermonuclease family)
MFSCSVTREGLLLAEWPGVRATINQRPERVRLSGIDSAERGQATGQRGKHAASDLAFGKDVALQTHGLDR